MISEENFYKITTNIIDKLEGGYYHPDSYAKGAKRCNGKFLPASAFYKFYQSGETLYGLDRYAGHGEYYSTPQNKDSVAVRNNKASTTAQKYDAVVNDLKYIYGNKYTYISPYAKEFWETVDKENARTNWCHEYKPTGKLGERLKFLASKIMYDVYERYKAWAIKNGYATAKSFELVETDTYLLHNFVYSIWNGIGIFQKMSKLIQKEVNANNTDTTKINKVLIDYRKKVSWMKRSANVMENLYKTVPDFIKKKVVTIIKPIVENKKTTITILLIGSVIFYYIYKKKLFK
jgi:hypothetical protein